VCVKRLKRSRSEIACKRFVLEKSFIVAVSSTAGWSQCLRPVGEFGFE
jgi:hypothetical protein